MNTTKKTRRVVVIILSTIILYSLSFEGHANPEDLSPGIVRAILDNWLFGENKRNTTISIERIIKSNEYSQTAILNVKNFVYSDGGKRRVAENTTASADFLFEDQWKMIKFTLGECKPFVYCVKWDNLSVTESPASKDSKDSTDSTITDKNNTIFTSPEEAIVYYIEGIAKNDIDKILSACAINEMAEKFRYDLFTQRTGAMFPQIRAPSNDSFYVEMNKAYLTNTILNQVKLLSFGLLSHEKIDGTAISPVDSERINNFMRDINPRRLSKIKIEKMSFPSKRFEHDQSYLEMAKWMATYNGADELTERLVLFSFEQNFYYIGFGLLRYGQNWKIQIQNSNLGNTPALGTAQPITVHEFEMKINEE